MPKKGTPFFRRKLIRIERHQLGPRVFLVGMRWHDWHVGALVLLLLALGAATGHVHDSLPTSLAAVVGLWLIAKDWRDLTPRRRDTSAWRLGLHRRPFALRRFRRADPLPLLAAVAAAAIALVDLLSALTPNVSWRGHLLLQIGSVQELRVFHALAIPVSIVLFVSAYYLYRRHLRALQLAVLLLLALAVLNLFKGLDFEEAAGDLAVAAILWLGRGSFYVDHEPLNRRAALLRAPFVAAAGVLLSFVLVLIAGHGASFSRLARETGDLLLWQSGPLSFHDELGRLDLAVGLVGVSTVAVVAYLVFRPLAAPRDLPDAEARRAARELVRRHGSDTLAYFKLRRDKHYLFTHDRRAFLGYRVETGVLLVSGDPIGPTEAIPELLEQLGAFAERRGLRVAAIGVGETLKPHFEQLGLRSFYIGDEAIVDTAAFTLEGRPIRKVRQSVSRLEKAGYTSRLVRVSDLDNESAAALERVSAAWRGREGERGFSMALDSLRIDEHADTLVLVALDGEAQIRGFLHFVPSYGRAAVSLSLMRRDPETPNGLTEFMVANAIDLLRAQGIDEVSLNFAAFARFIHSPKGRAQRLFRRGLGWADAVFQIERLYRFTAKFFPRWEPRYLMYESGLGLARVALAALWIEGQIPKPRFRSSSRRKKAAARPVEANGHRRG
jgi:lysyl-tRNA synthetase class 2